MTDIIDLKRMLADTAQAVAEKLLPSGRMAGHEWECGSVRGEAGKSLKVHLRGSKAGLWSDFATGDGGDLIDLWRMVKGQTLVEALDDIRGYLGVEPPRMAKEPEREWARPRRKESRKPKGGALAYLREDRNLPAEVITAYKIGESPDGKLIHFPFLRDGELIMVKAREARDGARPKPTAAGCEPILFGWQAMPDDSRKVYITEGEIDALSLAAYGFPALSVPFGGGGGRKQAWIESEFDRLARFEAIYLCLDDDGPGREAVAEISRRLGRHRCRVVTLPRKDCNECLVDGVSMDDIQAAIDASETMDPDDIARVLDYGDSVVNLFWPKDDRPEGRTFQYRALAEKVIFRPGEVTVWSGTTGSGKSQILSDCVVGWIRAGSRVVVASLEMTPAQTLKRMVKQAGGTDRPTKEFIRQVLDWLNDGLLLFNRVGKAKVETMLEAFEYCAARYGCDQFVIDSLMRLGIESDDYNGQEAVMYRIVDWAIDRNVHVHFVCHSRKGERGQGPQGAEDIKGAMEIGANASNVISIWRDPKWEELASGSEANDLSEKERRYLDAGGVVLNVIKQRNGDWSGRVRLHFDIGTYQYRSNQDQRDPRQAVYAA